MQEFSIQGFPTIKFFGEEKDSPSEYQGGRDLDSLETYVLNEWRKQQPPPEVHNALAVPSFPVVLSDPHLPPTNVFLGRNLHCPVLAVIFRRTGP